MADPIEELARATARVAEDAHRRSTTHRAVGQPLPSAPVIPVPAWPDPLNDLAYHGLLGRIVRAIEPHTEADPVAVLVQMLILFGSAVGRSGHLKIEGTLHHANAFALLIGDTAKARKGTSWGRVKQVFELADPKFMASCVAYGVSARARA